MPSKEQTHSNDKTSSKQRSPKPATGNLDILTQQQTCPATLIQRAKLDPGSLTPRDVLQLQRTIANRTVGRLLAQTAQHQPMQKEASTDLTSAISGARGSGQPLDAGLQRSMGQAMGADFSGVQQNSETRKPEVRGNEPRGNTAVGPKIQRAFDFTAPPTDASQFNLQFGDSLKGLTFSQKTKLFTDLQNDTKKYKKEDIPAQIAQRKKKMGINQTTGSGKQESEKKGKGPAIEPLPSMGRIENPNWKEISALLPSYGIRDKAETEKIQIKLEEELVGGEKIRGIPDLIGRALGPKKMAETARGIREVSDLVNDLGEKMDAGKLTKDQIINGLKKLDASDRDDPNFARALVEFVKARNGADFKITDLEKAPNAGMGKKHRNRNWTFRHYTTQKYDSLQSLAQLEAKGIKAGKNTNARDWEELGNQGYVFGLIAIDGEVPQRNWLSKMKYYAEYNLKTLQSVWVSGDMLTEEGRKEDSYQGTGKNVIAQLSKMLGFISQDSASQLDRKFKGVLEAKVPPAHLGQPEWTET